MRHHFDQIIFPDSDPDRQSGTDVTDRRTALKRIVAGGAAVLAASETAPADESKPAGYDRYLVIPRNFSRFRTARRTKLGIGGGYFRAAMKPQQKAPTAGFLAWLTKKDARRIAAEKDVAHVHRIAAEDVSDPGPRPAGTTQLSVRLLPNGWTRAKPPRGSYVETGDLIDRWSKKFDTVKFRPARHAGVVLIDVGAAGVPESMLKALKRHPQVVGIDWNAPVTTLALGEEGATTKALGEEGASTRRLGEEGGRPPLTRRLGETGGKPRPGKGRVTTLAVGEEGGRK